MPFLICVTAHPEDTRATWTFDAYGRLTNYCRSECMWGTASSCHQRLEGERASQLDYKIILPLWVSHKTHPQSCHHCVPSRGRPTGQYIRAPRLASIGSTVARAGSLCVSADSHTQETTSARSFWVVDTDGAFQHIRMHSHQETGTHSMQMSSSCSKWSPGEIGAQWCGWSLLTLNLFIDWEVISKWSLSKSECSETRHFNDRNEEWTPFSTDISSTRKAIWMFNPIHRWSCRESTKEVCVWGNDPARFYALFVRQIGQPRRREHKTRLSRYRSTCFIDESATNVVAHKKDLSIIKKHRWQKNNTMCVFTFLAGGDAEVHNAEQ